MLKQPHAFTATSSTGLAPPHVTTETYGLRPVSVELQSALAAMPGSSTPTWTGAVPTQGPAERKMSSSLRHVPLRGLYEGLW